MMMRFALPSLLLAGAMAGAQAPVYGGAQGVFTPVTCRNALTEQQEIAEGDKVVAEVYRQMPVLADSDPVARYVRQVGDRLVAVAPTTPGLETQWPFRFHVVASGDINAFALPGGTMFVNLGAIQAAQTEDQLAGVMAHEMSHVILRHSTCNLEKQQHRSVLFGLGQVASGILLGGPLGSLASAGIGAGANLSFLKMSRGDEQQADLLGVQILRNAGYDPRGLGQMFEIIQARYGAGGAQFLSDHPNPGNRTEYVNAEIGQLPPLANPTVNTDAFRRAHELAARMTVYTAQQVQGGAWRSTGAYVSEPGGTAARPAVLAPAGTSPRTPLPASGDAAGTPVAGAVVSGATIAPLPSSALGLRAPLTRYQADTWSMAAPRGWAATRGGADGAVTLAPAGGSGQFGLAYVVLGMRVPVTGQGVGGAEALAAQTRSLVATLAQKNGLAASGEAASLTIAGQPALSQQLSGVSPVAVGGQAVPEHDWLVTVARGDGDMDAFLFVCPQRDWPSLQDLFTRMRDSIRPE